MASATAGAQPGNALKLGRHVVGMALVALANPLIYFGPAGVFSWIVPWVAALLAAGVLYALFLLFFTARAKAAWPGSFIVLAWVMLGLQLAGYWVNYSQAGKLDAMSQAAPTQSRSTATPAAEPSDRRPFTYEEATGAKP